VSPRSPVYTRQDTARLCRRSLRTIIRWEEDGLLTQVTNPSDPDDRRVYYARSEVDALARRLRRLLGGGSDPPPDEPSGTQQPARARESSRSKVPRRRRPPPPRTPAAPKPGLVRAIPRSPPGPNVTPQTTRAPPLPPAADSSAPRYSPKAPQPTSHAPLPNDAEAEQWAREIDERRKAWEAEQAGAAGTSNASPSPSDALATLASIYWPRSGRK